MSETKNGQNKQFQYKIQKINHSNQVLNHLEKRMQTYFSKRSTQHQYPKTPQNHQQSEPHLLTSNLTQYQNQLDNYQILQQQKKYNLNQIYHNDQNLHKKIVTRQIKYDDQQNNYNRDKILDNKQTKNGIFKLFTKKQKNQNVNYGNIQFKQQKELQLPWSKYQQKYQPNVNKSLKTMSNWNKPTNKNLQVQNNFQIVEQVFERKLKIKQQQLTTLQKQLKLQNQQKVHLYKINIQLQEQLNKRVASITQQQQAQISQLQSLLISLNHQLTLINNQRKKLISEQQLLKQQHKNILKYKKQYIQKDQKIYQNEIQANNLRHHSSKNKLSTINNSIRYRTSIISKKDQKVYSMVVNQLDRLKTKVQKLKNKQKKINK